MFFQDQNEAKEQFEMATIALIQPQNYWRMADGRFVQINTMKDSHLLNTIRFLERNKGTVHPAYKTMVKLAKKRKMEPLQ